MKGRTTKSKLAEEMNLRRLEQNMRLSPQERLKIAFELSEICRKFKDLYARKNS